MYRKRWQWHPPWRVTDWWRPRAFRGSDEYDNPSFSVVVPPLGWFVMFYRRKVTR